MNLCQIGIGSYINVNTTTSIVAYKFHNTEKDVWGTEVRFGPNQGIILYYPVEKVINQLKAGYNIFPDLLEDKVIGKVEVDK